MEDILSALDEIETKPSSKKSVPISQVEVGRLDYANLKKMMQKQNLYAVKNVGEQDLACDWDLNLIPEEMKGDFDKYLSEKYNIYQIKEANLDFRIVVLYRDGRSINFLHQFMTEKKVPNLESVSEGKETLIKSQFVLPKGAMAVITESQYESLRRYEKKRAKAQDKDSDWSGVLVFKKLNEDNVSKMTHSFVTLEDVKNNKFEVAPEELGTIKRPTTVEYSEELDEL